MRYPFSYNLSVIKDLGEIILVRAEFHCHTIFSKDSLTRPADLLETCRHRGIDRLAVTDHNTLAGALAARRLDPDRVIVGEEIMTARGELLAFFVQEEVPRGLPPLVAIRRLRQQGAFISVSHPFDSARNGAWALQDLLEITPLVDALETFNSRCAGPRPNLMAQAFAIEHNLPGTVGSDAHILWEVGRSTLLLEDFKDAGELRTSIRQAQASQTASPFWVHFASTYARLYKRMNHPK